MHSLNLKLRFVKTQVKSVPQFGVGIFSKYIIWDLACLSVLDMCLWLQIYHCIHKCIAAGHIIIQYFIVINYCLFYFIKYCDVYGVVHVT
jgi:hypothetical protein